MEQSPSSNEDQTQAESTTLLLVTFKLGDSDYGIDTARVQEVVRPGGLTPVHHAPPWITGIRNLRGRIITVIDLGVRLGLKPVEENPENRILMVDWQGETVGLLVDLVGESIETDAAKMTPSPQKKYLCGVCRNGVRLVAILDLEELLQVEANPVNGN